MKFISLKSFVKILQNWNVPNSEKMLRSLRTICHRKKKKNEINPIFDSSRFLFDFVQSFDKNKIDISKRM
ncbi:hypothetical protein DLM75_18225 [Leptospira stimsonii]|uniref:Uncharacterized protein n=1 Tax=Leptospira stimsonii TaxID=2202203 RepID=A0A396YWG7_9LEPT|nr:hypothetical protein DLM75_18225 [Leptospira stimsonii]